MAHKRAAKQVALSSCPSDHWPARSLANLHCLDLATLYGLLLGQTHPEDDAYAQCDTFEEIYRGMSCSTWPSSPATSRAGWRSGPWTRIARS